jgi:hypothetical protein
MSDKVKEKVLLIYLGYYGGFRLSILGKITEYTGISVIIKKQYMEHERYKYRMMVLHRFVGRNNLVGIATRYGLGSPGMESRQGAIFFHTRPDWLWRPSSLLYNVYQISSQGVKRSERDFGHTPPGSEVKNRVELHLYSPSGTPRPLLG